MITTAQIITSETHGSNCFHLSLLANSDDPVVRSLIPEDTVVSKVPVVTGMQEVKFSAIL